VEDDCRDAGDGLGELPAQPRRGLRPVDRHRVRLGHAEGGRETVEARTRGGPHERQQQGPVGHRVERVRIAPPTLGDHDRRERSGAAAAQSDGRAVRTPGAVVERVVVAVGVEQQPRRAADLEQAERETRLGGHHAEPGEQRGRPSGLVRLDRGLRWRVELPRRGEVEERRPGRLGVAVTPARRQVGGIGGRLAAERQPMGGAEHAKGEVLAHRDAGERPEGAPACAPAGDVVGETVHQRAVERVGERLPAQPVDDVVSGRHLVVGIGHAGIVAARSTLTDSTSPLGRHWLTSAEACARLGVRTQTLYAYVSRGLLHPRRVDRRSWYDRNELDLLAAAGRRRARRGRLEVLIDTEVTLLDPAGRLAYRGVDVADLAGRWSFERVARWLWTGEDDGEPAPWPMAPGEPAPGGSPSDRIRVAAAVAAATATDSDRDLARVATIGSQLIPVLVSALPPIGPSTGVDAATVAGRLWPRLTALKPTPARVQALDAALVLLADHELAPSTVGARVAASVWSPPLDVVVAALATHAGGLHGGVMTTIEDQLRVDGGSSVGRGHPVYGDAGDPRARLLLPLALAAAPARERPLVAAAGDPSDGPPNVDLVLAALAVATGMVRGASEAVFAVARSAGWLAHAAEEYRNPLRFRPRASYTGTAPIPRPSRDRGPGAPTLDATAHGPVG